MIGLLPNTIIPWLLGGLLLLVLLTLSISIKSWHESKRSPYYFLRMQAAKRLRRYLAITIVLILLTIVTTAYAWQAPEDTTARVALLSHAKRPTQVGALESAAEPSASGSPATVDIDLLTVANSGGAVTPGLANPILQPSTLPEEYDQLKPSVELADDANLGTIAFSTDISDDYGAVDPGRRFPAGYFTLYATFAYENMADGMVWSWVWRRNGQVIDGGNQLWDYGGKGPGYVYFRPEEGFGVGGYSLEVWVNQELLAQSSFSIIDGISAGN